MGYLEAIKAKKKFHISIEERTEKGSELTLNPLAIGPGGGRGAVTAGGGGGGGGVGAGVVSCLNLTGLISVFGERCTGESEG